MAVGRIPRLPSSYDARVRRLSQATQETEIQFSAPLGLGGDGTVTLNLLSSGGLELSQQSLAVKLDSSGPITRSSSGLSLSVDKDSGLDVQSSELTLQLASVSGLSASVTGLTVKLDDPSSGLQLLADGLSVLVQSPIFVDALGIGLNESLIDHDNLLNFVANEHIDHSTVSIVAGDGLTGGGTIVSNVTLSVLVGTGLAVDGLGVRLSHLGLESLVDPNMDKILYWDDTAGATSWLEVTSPLIISSGTLMLFEPGIDHNNLMNLDQGDPHTQYFLTSGRSGNNDYYVGTDASAVSKIYGSSADSGVLVLGGSPLDSMGTATGIVRIEDTTYLELTPNIASSLPSYAATQLRFVSVASDGSSALSEFVSLEAPKGLTSTVNYKLPPAPTGDGYILSSDTSGNMSFVPPTDGTVTSIDVQPSPTTSGLTTSGGPITTSGVINIDLNDNLSELSLIPATDGFIQKTAIGPSFDTRTFLGTSGNISVSNGNGVDGDPVINLVATGVTSGSYGAPDKSAQLTVDSFGRITSASESPISVDHGSLLGLSDDDHTQYVMVDGRGDGQTISGGSGSTGDLIFRANKDARGDIKTEDVQNFELQSYFVTTVESPAKLKFSYSGNFISFRASSAITVSTEYVWPTSDGTSGQVLTTDGSGNLSWATVSGSGTDTFAIVKIDSGAAMNDAAPTLDFNGSDFLISESPANNFDISIKDSGIDHDSTMNFVSSEHVDHTAVNIIAGNGLTGGGTIDSNVTLDIGSGTGITVSADSISVDQAALDHGSIGGLADDDHSQYALLAGRTGGQVLVGGTDSVDDLQLRGTSASSVTSSVINLSKASAVNIKRHINASLNKVTPLRFYDTSNTNYVSLQAADSISANVSFVLPDSDGISGQVLTTDGMGALSWTDKSSGGTTDHGSLAGLNDVEDHPGYVTLDGTRPLTASWDAGPFTITALSFASDVATGTAPFTVLSTTQVANLNADLLDGNHASAFQSADAGLSSLASIGANGVICRTAADTFAPRTLTGTANQVIVSNGQGVSGDPTFSLPQDIHTNATNQFNTTTLSTLKLLDSAGDHSVSITYQENATADRALNLQLGDGSRTVSIKDTLTFEAISGDHLFNQSLSNIASPTFSELILSYENTSPEQAMVGVLKIGDDQTGASKKYVTLQPPSSLVADYSLTLPPDSGSSGQVLTTDGTGVLSWSTGGGGGGASNLNDLSDVTLTSPVTNDVLVFNGTDWVNQTRPNAGLLVKDGVAGGQTLIGGTGITNNLSLKANSGALDSFSSGGFIKVENSRSLRLIQHQEDGAEVATSLSFQSVNTGTPMVNVVASDSQSGDYTLTLPVDAGNSGEFLTTDGMGNLSWSPQSTPSLSLDDLTDVTSMPMDDDSLLVYNSSSSLWESQSPTDSGYVYQPGLSGGQTIHGGNATSETDNLTIKANSATASASLGSVLIENSSSLDLVRHTISGADNTTELRFQSRDMSMSTFNYEYVGFKAPDSVDSSVIWTLPSADGSANQVLSTNGSGVLSWVSSGGGGGSLDGLSDVTITSADDLDILVYDAGLSAWVDKSPENTPFVVKNGVSGGQTVIGGTQMGDSLTIRATSSAMGMEDVIIEAPQSLAVKKHSGASSTAEIRLYDSANTSYTGIASPSSNFGLTWSIPSQDSGPGVWKTDGSGTLSASALSLSEISELMMGGNSGDIVGHNGSSWDIVTPENSAFVVESGISGGQTVYGGTGSMEELSLKSTSDVSKGGIRIGDFVYFDEGNEKIGIGNSFSSVMSPEEILHIRDSSAVKFLFDRVNDGTSGPIMRGRLARGTIGAESVVNDGDSMFVFGAEGYAGSVNGFQPGAQIQFLVDGTPTDAPKGVPAEILFKVSDGTALVTLCRYSQLLGVRVDNKDFTVHRGDIITGTHASGTGNIVVGNGGVATSATNTITIKTGTAPASNLTDTVQLYAEGTNAVLKVRDEIGNIVPITPHDFSIVSPPTDVRGPWTYVCRNPYLGVDTHVDMAGAIRELERISGRKFIHEKELPEEEKLDWTKHQVDMWITLTEHRDRIARKKQDLRVVRDAIIRKIEILNLIGDAESLKELEEAEAELESVRISIKTMPTPPKPKIKHPPGWMQERGVYLDEQRAERAINRWKRIKRMNNRGQ